MHELTLANEILKFVLKEAKDSKITSIKIALADDGHTTSESLSEAFGLISQGTLAEGAELKIEEAGELDTRVVDLEVEK